LTEAIEEIGGVRTAGKSLKSTSGWDSYNGESGNGDDKYDFSALPGGFGKSDGDSKIGNTGLWWSASKYSGHSGNAGINIVNYGDRTDYYFYDKEFLLSVRCLQDNGENAK